MIFTYGLVVDCFNKIGHHTYVFLPHDLNSTAPKISLEWLWCGYIEKRQVLVILPLLYAHTFMALTRSNREIEYILRSEIPYWFLLRHYDKFQSSWANVITFRYHVWFKLNYAAVLRDLCESKLSFLIIHSGLVTPYGGRDLGQHWFR